MLNETILHADDSSAEQVARKLMLDIMIAENMVLEHNAESPYRRANRKYILDLYAQCICTIRNGYYEA